jgi:hypothetical protein
LVFSQKITEIRYTFPKQTFGKNCKNSLNDIGMQKEFGKKRMKIEKWHFQNIFVFIFRRNLLCCIWDSSHWDSSSFLWHHRWRQSSEAFAAKASTSILPSDDGEPPWVDVEFRIRGTTSRSTRSTRGVTADRDDVVTSSICRGQTWRSEDKQSFSVLTSITC